MSVKYALGGSCSRVAALSTILLLPAACSSPATDQSLAGGTGPADGLDDGADRDTDGEHGDGGAEDGGGPAGTGGDEGDEAGGAPPGEMAVCPSRLPPEWVFCEDFEDLGDPAEVFFEYQDSKGAFVPVEGVAASGYRSMRATYTAGADAAGWFSIAFGENPIAVEPRPLYDEGERFQEIYWRFRIMTEPGWPDVGPHRLSRATAFAQEDWSQAMVAELGSTPDDVTLSGQALTCVLDNDITCVGYNDSAELADIGTLTGDAPLFSSAWSGRWHCVEGHVALNTPGDSDGVFEFWIDDVLQARRQDLNWRGTWDAYGLNLVSIENFWTGGAPSDLSRYIDDVVISTEPIACD